MNEGERMYAELLRRLEGARATYGRVDPHISYFERLINAAAVNLQSLSDLYNHVQREGGFK